jgi:hypothetical protein
MRTSLTLGNVPAPQKRRIEHLLLRTKGGIEYTEFATLTIFIQAGKGGAANAARSAMKKDWAAFHSTASFRVSVHSSLHSCYHNATA